MFCQLLYVFIERPILKKGNAALGHRLGYHFYLVKFKACVKTYVDFKL